MRRFVVTGKNFEGEMEFHYALNGALTNFENRAKLEGKQLEWLSGNFPTTLKAMYAFLAQFPNLTGAEILEKATFEMFWNAYAYKVDKALAEKQWNKLSEMDKWVAIESVEAYDKYLAKKQNQDKLYACRYLERKRFLVDYAALK